MRSTSAETTTLLIVGGVAGGASAATRARRMNERMRIVLFEKDDHVSFANCGLPYHLGGEIAERSKLLVTTPELLEQRFRIEVRERHEVLSIDRRAKTVEVLDRRGNRRFTEPYDKLILAPGARPLVPPIPGAGARGVFTLRNLEDLDRLLAASGKARHCVVAGGGFIGLEVAEQLQRRGLHVTLVEMQPQVLPLLDPELAEYLHREIESHGVTLRLGVAVAGIEERDGAVAAVRLADGSSVVADLVLFGLGVRPNTDLAATAGLSLGSSGGIGTGEFMQTSDPDIYAVGDAAEYAFGPTGARQRVALAGPANRTGRLAGEHAATGHARAAPAAWGTSIVRVFGKTAGLTGLSTKAARKAGLVARSVHITANHHAGYFPGAEPMVLKLVYEAGTGRLLGAQAVGGAGVDKRIDVLATTLHHRGTVHDLAQLDLAYAPPFGSAKDPVHIAAFAAQNDLAGTSRLLEPDADLGSYQVVDLRSPDEIASLPLAGAPHARNIPVDQLRARLGELDRDRPTVAVCKVGLRGHVATRILAQSGFRDVHNLSGGASVRDHARNRRTPSPATAALAAAPCGSNAVSACASAGSGADAKDLDVAELAARLATGSVDLVDVRTGAEYRTIRVRGARHVPLDALTAAAVRAGRPSGASGPVLLLCKGGSRARTAASRLRAEGVDCVVVSGGTDACCAAGVPVERDTLSRVWPIERQVRLAAGVMALVGVALGVLVHPAAFGLVALVGVGLTFAGLTDYCGMALLLGRCPWNR